MDVSVDDIHRACSDLRRAQTSLLAPMPQADVVAAIAEWAARWKDPLSPWRCAARCLNDPFPFAMTRISLDALLDSLTPDALWALIDAEHVRDAKGVSLVGHVIAGNTPLLAWVSSLRALLMRSASFVKLPSGGAAEWGRLFVRTLAEAAPALASCVHLMQWTGGTIVLDAVLCRSADLLLAYGSKNTVEDLHALCPPSTDFQSYNHRVSFGIVPADAAFETSVEGFAQDVLLYDQGGCLSPHTIFVQTPWSLVLDFGERLASALQNALTHTPQVLRTPQAAARVQEARLLARMEAESRLWEDRHQRWTVIATKERRFVVSPTHAIVSIQQIGGPEELDVALSTYAGHLQGCAVALGADQASRDEWIAKLERLGVSWICRPGELQTPPFAWREDGKDVLRCMLPASLR